MDGYDGADLRERYDHSNAPGMAGGVLPPGWAKYDPAAGEADGEEAYMFANGHQVLIGKTGDGRYFVLAYPEMGITDLMGFVRDLLANTTSAMYQPAHSLPAARYFARGYMAAVLIYENQHVDKDLIPRL